jgi:hypothetical protein
MRQIQTSISFPKEVVISAGLKREEVISLSKPSVSVVKEKVLLPVKSKDSVSKEEKK